jgi:hypothetical protein
VISAGSAFVEHLRNGHYKLVIDVDPRNRLPAAFTKLVLAIRSRRQSRCLQPKQLALDCAFSAEKLVTPVPSWESFPSATLNVFNLRQLSQLGAVMPIEQRGNLTKSRLQSSHRAPPAEPRRVSALVASADMADERAGEAYEGEERLTVVGPKLSPSEIAPDFALDHFDGQAIQGVTLADSDGSIRILNVVNSLDTPICDIETRRVRRRSTVEDATFFLSLQG